MKLLFPTKATTKISGRMAQRTFEDKMGDKKQAKRWWKVKFLHNLESCLNLSHMTENNLFNCILKCRLVPQREKGHFSA